MYFLKDALNFALSFLENKIGWHLVYEDDACSLH